VTRPRDGLLEGPSWLVPLDEGPAAVWRCPWRGEQGEEAALAPCPSPCPLPPSQEGSRRLLSIPVQLRWSSEAGLAEYEEPLDSPRPMALPGLARSALGEAGREGLELPAGLGVHMAAGGDRWRAPVWEGLLPSEPEERSAPPTPTAAGEGVAVHTERELSSAEGEGDTATLKLPPGLPLVLWLPWLPLVPCSILGILSIYGNN